MSELLGADTRRVDLVAEGLRGYSQDIQNLRTAAQRAVAELRNAWGGADFERLAQRWEDEAGPRLTDMSSVLSTMATALRAQAEAQRLASGDTGGSSVLMGTGGTPGDPTSGGSAGGAASGGGGGGAASGDTERIEDLDPGDVDVTLLGPEEVNDGEKFNEPTVASNVKLNIAEGDVTLLDESLASMRGGGEGYEYELSAGKVEAKADYSVDLDAGGNFVASAGVSAAAYAGYAAGKVKAGNDFVNVAADGRAYVGAETKADASGSIGPDGARGHLGAEAFAGGKAEANVSGTLAGVTATTGAEISYGIGAHANLDAEFSTSKVGVSVDIGATLGIGAGLKFDVSINPTEVIADVGHAVDDVSKTAQDVGEGLASAGDQVANFFDW